MPTCGSGSIGFCTSAADERSLRAEILVELRRVIDFDSYVWLLTDPLTTVGCAPLADIPCLPQLPTLIRLKYLTTVNRWSSLAESRLTVGLLEQSTSGDLALSIMWRELLQDFEIRDIASVVFADIYGCWGFLDLWRQRGEPFSTADSVLLKEDAPRSARLCGSTRR
jgi:hypothetical protein